MSVVDEVKTAWKTPRGKTIMLVAAGGLTWFWWSRNRSSAATADGSTEVTTQDRIPAATGGGGGGGGGGDTTTPDDARPKDNFTWLTKAVSALSSPPYNYDSVAVFNALTLFLGGLQVTTAQQAIVSAAIQLLGSPPEGAPPLNTAPPSTTTPPTTNPPAARYSPEYSLSVSKGQKVTAFTDQIRARSGIDVDWSLLEATNPSLAGDINWGPSGSKDLNIRVFKRANTYKIPAVRVA